MDVTRHARNEAAMKIEKREFHKERKRDKRRLRERERETMYLVKNMSA
jgi:hypothetical protein